MKILVFSDSHGRYAKMNEAVKLHPDTDMIIFLGDGLRDADALFEAYPHIPHVAVKGNCDFSSTYGSETYLDEQTLDISKVRIFCCHGHKYNVKSSEISLWFRAREKEAALALFGHTHEPFERVYEGVRLFNPGSISLGSFGVVYVENGAVVASHGRI